MSWTTVDRTEQISALRGAVRSPCGGPIVLTGEPRMGRTSLLERALEDVDERQVAVIRLRATGDRTAFSALAPLLPRDFKPKPVPSTAVVAEVATALADPAGRRLVVAVDDAHRVDHVSMLVVRELHRRACALPLITQPDGPLEHGQPDPLDCLRHEPGLRVLRLPPLSRDEVGTAVAGLFDGPVLAPTVTALHAATGGNPGLLHDLLVTGRLAERLVRADERWRLPDTGLSAGGGSAPTRLLEALSSAWRNLDLEVAEELCRLAAWSGRAEEVAPIWAGVLLLRGKAEAGLAILDRWPATTVSPRQTMVRAQLLGLGIGQVDAAAALLAAAAGSAGAAGDRLLAHRAWLLAITGRLPDAVTASADLEPSTDREAYVYTLATRATVELAAGHPGTAVGHLRRALAGVRQWRTDVPWLAPYLTAILIDALLLAGRITEATVTAADFHAGTHSAGWRTAVTVADLASGTNRQHTVLRPNGARVDQLC